MLCDWPFLFLSDKLSVCRGAFALFRVGLLPDQAGGSPLLNHE